MTKCNSYDKFYNDPEIVNEPKSLREIHAIRLKIYDDTKNMNPTEIKNYYKKGKDIAKAHGFKIVKSA